MPETIVIDGTFVQQLDQGHPEAARELKNAINAHADVYYTWTGWLQLPDGLSQDSATRRLFEDLQITRMPYRHVSAPLGTRTSYKALQYAEVAKFVADTNARVLTFDEDLVNAVRRGGGRVVDYSRNPVGGTADFNRTRRLLGLPPLNIVGSRVVPRPNPKATRPGLPRTAGGARTTAFSMGKGMDPRVNVAAAEAVRLVLKGVNYIIQGINGRIQQERVDAAVAKIKPEIERVTAADPSLGVLIRIHFSRRTKIGAEEETPLEHTHGFQYVTYEFGHTQDEARERIEAKPQARPAGQGEVFSNDLWVPPAKPLDIGQTPTPFPTAGLATFVPEAGKLEPAKGDLVKVKFSHLGGFDDKMFSVERVPVSAGMMMRFFILFPPEKIGYFHGRWRKRDLQLSLVAPAMVVDQDLLATRIPVVDLDSSINPYDAKAAMVYPANDATAKLFMTTRATDHGGTLSKSWNMIRWVKPHNILLLTYAGAIKFG